MGEEARTKTIDTRWFPIAQNRDSHPKIAKAARLLGVDKHLIMGWTEHLYSWAMDGAPDGVIELETLLGLFADWCRDHRPEAVVQALSDCGRPEQPGLLEVEPDGMIRLHEWENYAGSRLKRLKRWVDASKKRRQDNENSSVSRPSRDRLETVSRQSTPTDSTDSTYTSDSTTPPPPFGGEPTVPAKPRDDAFEEFWQAYPRKVGKAAARKAWLKIKPSQDLQSRILTAVHAQRECSQWTKDGGQFIPHPTTWLNQGRWDDEPEPKKPVFGESGIIPSQDLKF